jgi:hypothetical protein
MMPRDGTISRSQPLPFRTAAWSTSQPSPLEVMDRQHSSVLSQCTRNVFSHHTLNTACFGSSFRPLGVSTSTCFLNLSFTIFTALYSMLTVS